MKALQGGRGLLASVPVDRIVAVVTSAPDYEMSRLVYVEDWPEYDDHSVIDGGHCSCYGFEDTEWTGTTYTRDELRVAATKWQEDGLELEREIAPAILRALA